MLLDFTLRICIHGRICSCSKVVLRIEVVEMCCLLYEHIYICVKYAVVIC